MKGYRKLILGIVFLLCVTFLSYVGITRQSDLLGLSTVIGAISAGVFGIVYGNIKEHQVENNHK